MSLESKRHQKSRQLELPMEGCGEAAALDRSGELRSAAHENERSGNADEKLLELVVESSNVEAALRRVKKNKGSPGIDGMTVEELPAYVAGHWTRIREEILAGRYEPKPVRRYTIPKKGGGFRELGIPTVVDRLIQQCILHVLQRRFDPSFSPHSYGFRPGRSAHDAVGWSFCFIAGPSGTVVDASIVGFRRAR